MDLNKLSDEELKEILLTVDGRGKATKEAALDALLAREYNTGWIAGEANERGDT